MSANGFDNLMWFMGVVEDNNDPQRMGRVKARAFGIHPPDKTQVPTEDLPWAWIISGTYGPNYKPPAVNSWVFGFFIDGKLAQHPMLVGSMLGMPTNIPSTDPNDGFNNVNHTTENSPIPTDIACKMFQPDMSRLARREELQNTNVLVKNMSAGEGVEGPSPETSWYEPGSSYNADYPHNYVHETSSGHAIELDDTPGEERVHIYHKSGTSIEIDSRGTITIVSEGDSYSKTERSSFNRVKGDENTHVGANANIRIKGNNNVVIDGDYNLKVHGSMNVDVAQQLNFNVGNTIKARGSEVVLEANQGNMYFDAKGKMQSLSGGDMTHETLTSMHTKVGASKFEDITTDHNIKVGGSTFTTVGLGSNFGANTIVFASNAFDVGSGTGNITMTGTKIDLNGPAASAATAAGNTTPADTELGKTKFQDPIEIRTPATNTKVSFTPVPPSPHDDQEA